MIYIQYDSKPPETKNENFVLEHTGEVYTYTCDYCFAEWHDQAEDYGNVRILLSGFGVTFSQIPNCFRISDGQLNTIMNYVGWLRSVGVYTHAIKQNAICTYNKQFSLESYALVYPFDESTPLCKTFFDLNMLRFLTYEFFRTKLPENCTALEYFKTIFSLNQNTAHIPIQNLYSLNASAESGRRLYEFFSAQKDRNWNSGLKTLRRTAGIHVNEYEDFLEVPHGSCGGITW